VFLVGHNNALTMVGSTSAGWFGPTPVRTPFTPAGTATAATLQPDLVRNAVVAVDGAGAGACWLSNGTWSGPTGISPPGFAP
jgi:hypothetical protein